MLNYGVYEELGISDIYDKVRLGERLDICDGERLFACSDVLAVGALAHHVRTRLNGNAAYYVVNRQINYSNICVNGCRFCAFGCEEGDADAFSLSIEAILGKLKACENLPVTEVHIVGGCHPDLRLGYYEDLLREIKTLRPGILIKAFTAVEIEHFARLEGLSSGEVLLRLKSAGLDMLPGGGAEIFSSRVRGVLCPKKLSGQGWLDVVRQAHKSGIKTNATMLYGHIETQRERLEHLIALRELQDETGGFVCFIPLSFQPANTNIPGIEPVTGIEDLKTIAISRLMLDNIPHVKAYWVLLTVKLAQVALHFGADDLDGTVIEEKIGHMAGAESEQGLTRTQLARIINEAGFNPIERNCFFEPVGDSGFNSAHSA
ncbi:MAG: aminofutalosine synthase MqnE [Syntrophobacteraceae bacterium]